MRKATTLEFRAAVRRALAKAGIGVHFSYTDKPVKMTRGSNIPGSRYVALEIGSEAHEKVAPVLTEVNQEFERRGLDTRARHVGFYVRGVCQAA